MTVQELYDKITSQMSPEEALMKLLSYQTEQYEALKNMKVPEGEGVNPIYIIACAAADLGWDMALEKEDPNNPDAHVEGIAVGTDNYFKRLFNEKENNTSGDQGGCSPTEQCPEETLQRGTGDSGPHKDGHSLEENIR